MLQLTKNNSLFFFVVFITAGVIYLNGVSDNFLNGLDDDWCIYDNPSIEPLNVNTLYQIWLNKTEDCYYIPLTFTSFSIDIAVWGKSAYLMKLENLFFFLMSALVITFFLLRLKVNKDIVLLTVILFLLHPMQVENIAWAVGRRQVLSLMFFLLSALFYYKFVYGPKPNYQYVLFSLLFFVFSVSAKFSSCVFVPLAIAISWVFPQPKAPQFYLRVAVTLLLFFLITCGFYLINMMTMSRNFLATDFHYSTIQQILIILSSFGFYLKRIFIGPWSFFYTINASTNFDYTQYTIACLGIIALTAFSFISFYFKEKIITAGLLWFIIALTPSALLVALVSDLPVNTADRYFFIASPGIFIALSALAQRLLKNKLNYFSVIVTVVLALSTHQQIKTWHSSETVLEHNAKTYPSEEMLNRLACTYFEKGKYQNSFAVLDKADSLNRRVNLNNPYFFQIQLAYIYQSKGDSASALRKILQSLESDLVFLGSCEKPSSLIKKAQCLLPLSDSIYSNYASYLRIRAEITEDSCYKLRPNRL